MIKSSICNRSDKAVTALLMVSVTIEMKLTRQVRNLYMRKLKL